MPMYHQLSSAAPLFLQGFYEQVANLLRDVELLYPKEAVSDLTQHRHKQYYEGSEIMVAGRIADHKLSSFKADMRAKAVNRGLQRVERHSEAPHPQPQVQPLSFPRGSVPTPPCHTRPGLNILPTQSS